MKIIFALKKIQKKIKPYIGLPHIWTLLMVAILASIMCLLSVIYKDKNSFLSCICANIFSGLLTGVIICLVSTIKSVSLYKTECLIEWLDDLHKDCLEFISMHRKMIVAKKGDYKDDEEFCNYIYDTLCFGNEINQTISQGQFKEALPFNTYKYCKKEFAYDAVKVTERNQKLREDVLALDVSILPKADLRKMFEAMEHQILTLNGDILSKLRELSARKKAINKSIG